MIIDSTVTGEIPSPSSSIAPPKQQKGIWTCMMSAWCRQVLAAHLKWSFPSISVSLTLKDANPAETLGQTRFRCLGLLTKVVLVEDGGKSFFVYETLDSRGAMEAGFARKLNWGLFAVQHNWSSTLKMWYYHASHMTALLTLLYAIYCLITAPVSTRTDTTIHSHRPGMFPLPWLGIAINWHSGSSSQAPWETARSVPTQWPSVPESPHMSAPVFTSASSCSLETPSPRMCTLYSLHTTTYSAGLLISHFVVDAGRVGIPSTPFTIEGLLPWLHP